MKKILLVLAAISLSLVLFGCDRVTTSETTTSTLDDAVTEESEGYITIRTWSNDGSTILADKYMDAEFLNVSYTPANKQVCFDMKVFDLDYRTSDYYFLTRERGSTLTESQLKFNISMAAQTSTYCMGLSVTDEIVVVKSNSEDLNPTSMLDVMAFLQVDDAMAESRLYPEDGGYFTANIVTTKMLSESTPYVDFHFYREDSHRLLTSLYLEVYYEPFDAVIATKLIEITDEMYDGDVLEFKHIIIDGLSPDTDFEVRLYCSGNDGVEDYEYVWYATRSATSSRITDSSLIVNAMPSLWGEMYDYEIGDGVTNVSYYLCNDGKVTYQDEMLDVVLRIYDQSGTMIKEYPMETGYNSVPVEQQYIHEYDYIQMVTAQNNIVLSRMNINYGLYNSLDYFSYQNKVFKFYLMMIQVNVEITSIEIALRKTATGTPIFEKTITDIHDGWYEFNVSSTTTSLNDLYITYTITYTGFGGVETFTQSPHIING